MKTFALTGLLILLGVGAQAQDTPQDIDKKDLPKKAVCILCTQGGEDHGEEKTAAGVRYKGKNYYFCNVAEVKRFKENPEAFMPPVLPRPAPQMLGQKLEGGSVSLADYKDKVVLVDFWATWCAPCVKVMPDMQKLHDKYADRGFAVVGVSIDEEGAEKVKPFLAKKRFTYPILVDTDKNTPLWKAFGVHAIPAVFLINRDGQIVQQWTGKVDKKEVEKAITALLEVKKAEAK